MDAPFGVAQEKRMVIPLPKMKPGILYDQPVYIHRAVLFFCKRGCMIPHSQMAEPFHTEVYSKTTYQDAHRHSSRTGES